MTAHTVAAKRRAKKARKSVQDLYREFERDLPPAPIKVEEDPLKAPMRARAIKVGENPSEKVLHPMLECEAGCALWVGVKSVDDRRRLFNVFLEYDLTRSLFASRVLNTTRFPAVSKMEFRPERLEASASDVVDLRSPQEKADAAKKKMAEWDAHLDRLPIWQGRIIRSVSNRQETCVIEGELTTAGRSFIVAIKALDEVANG